MIRDAIINSSFQKQREIYWNKQKAILFGIDIVLCLYHDIRNQNLNISKFIIYQNSSLALTRARSQNPFVVIYSTNLIKIYKNELYGNKLKLE